MPNRLASPETGTEIQGCVCVEEGWGGGGIHCHQHHPEYVCIVTDSGVSYLKVSFVQWATRGKVTRLHTHNLWRLSRTRAEWNPGLSAHHQTILWCFTARPNRLTLLRGRKKETEQRHEEKYKTNKQINKTNTHFFFFFFFLFLFLTTPLCSGEIKLNNINKKYKQTTQTKNKQKQKIIF